METNSKPRVFRKKVFKYSAWIILSGFLLTGVFIAAILIAGYIEASRPVSFLPEFRAGKAVSNDSTGDLEIKGSSYILSVKNNGKISIRTTGGKMIMSDLIYYSSYKSSGEKWGLDKELVMPTSDSTISIKGEDSSGALISMILTVPKNKPKIGIDIITRYNKNSEVIRESLVAGFDIPVSEVYKKNRQIDTSAFDSEYWLLREGIRFGRGERSALMYHTSGVSSLQADIKNNHLFINLDYNLDHPLMNIPFQKNGGGKWNDISYALYKAGDTRRNQFSIYFGAIPSTVPRIMLVPNGFLAGYVFTEHADGGTIRTHRAAYFGSEDITRIADAKGGFAGHNFPVTKSVFFPDLNVPVNASDSINSSEAQFLDFLNQLNTAGNDICLHGANTNRKEVDEWLKFMKDHFNTTTWIDHGMFDGTGNRQSFVCDGLNPSSEYYTADMWGKYDTKYFWNPSVEELIKLPVKESALKLKFYEASLNLWRGHFSASELKKMKFSEALKEIIREPKAKGEINSFLIKRGNSFPTPLFWQHPTRTENFYSWATDFVKTFSHSEKGVRDEEATLNKLISDRGIFIDHGYYVRDLYADGVLIKMDGKIIASPYFDAVLDIMATKQKKGDLLITTIRELLNYWILIENISFDYMADGTITITNLNNETIKGFSIAVKAGSVKLDGKIPDYRHESDDTILWFDIGPGQCRKLEIQ